MLAKAVDPAIRRAALGKAFRAVRQHRRLNQADVAAVMGLSLRTYIQLENGGGRATLEHLAAFALATDSDEVALFIATALDAPDLALDFADNKLMSIGAVQAEEFHHLLGPAVRLLLPTEALSAQTAAFDEMTEAASARDPSGNWDVRRNIRAMRPSEPA